jgi:hypothetical protein
MSISQLRSPSRAVDPWDALVAREVERQGDLQPDLDWFDRARELSGGLSPLCWAQRARLARELERRPR